MGFPKKEILIACVNTFFVLKILKTTRNKQKFPNKEMLMSYMTKLPFLEIDSNRFEIDSIRLEILLQNPLRQHHVGGTIGVGCCLRGLCNSRFK